MVLQEGASFVDLILHRGEAEIVLSEHGDLLLLQNKGRLDGKVRGDALDGKVHGGFRIIDLVPSCDVQYGMVTGQGINETRRTIMTR